MRLKISKQFAKDFKTITDQSLRKKVKAVLNTIKTAPNIHYVTQFRAVSGNDNAYKMGIGFYYMLGIVTSDDEMILMRFLHRDVLMKAINS